MTLHAPLVSIIVPAYNAERTILDTLESVRRQTYANLEILIVDDGSTDRTAEVAARFCAKEPRARLIRKKNGGVASARNEGIDQAKGEWFAPLDADDLWKPTKIEKQVAAAARAKVRPGFVFCYSHLIDANDRITGSLGSWFVSGPAFHQLTYVNFVGSGSNPLFCRDAALDAGRYDEGMQGGCEDLALQLRIARNHPVEVVPEYLVGYRRGPENMSQDLSQMSRAWQLLFERLRATGTRFSSRPVRWALAMQHWDRAEAYAVRGEPAGMASELGKALALDPLRTTMALGYRLTRLVGRLCRGPPEIAERPLFELADTRRCYREDPHEIVALARFIERFDDRRMRYVARMDERAGAA